MSKTVKSNVELLSSIIPDEAPEGMLPRVIYDGLLENRNWRSNYVDRLNEFGGLLMSSDVSAVERTAYIQIREALHTSNSEDVAEAMRATVEIYNQLEGMGKEERIAYLKELANSLKTPNAEKVHHVDSDVAHHKVKLGSETDLAFVGAGALAICFAGFSAFTGFLPAAWNLVLATIGANARTGGAWEKWRKRPEVIAQYPDVFNMAILETYVEGRLDRAFEPLESHMERQIEEEAKKFKLTNHFNATTIDADTVAVQMACQMFCDLIHKAPSRAVRLLRENNDGVGAEEHPKHDPRSAFAPLSTENELKKDKLSLERVFRQRFSFDSSSQNAIDDVRSAYSFAGVELDESLGAPKGDVTSDDRFEKVPNGIKLAANNYARVFAAANAERDMPMMRKMFDIPEEASNEEAAEQISAKVGEVLGRLAVAINYERRELLAEKTAQQEAVNVR